MNSFLRRDDKVPDPYSGQVTMTSVLSIHLKTIAAAAMVVALGSAVHLVGAMAEERSPIVDLSPGNAEMNAAIAKARATLPAFWASYEAPKPSEDGHSLKVSFPKPKSDNEHIWMAEVKKLPNGRYSGRFANQPRDLPGKRAGDLVEFSDADVSDWMFLRNGKIVGGETIRPPLKHMPKASADALRARMETP